MSAKVEKSLRALDSLDAERDRLAQLPNGRLRQELTESLRLTVEHLTRLALIVRELEDRGEDLSDLRLGILRYVRWIAHGRLLPESVIQFAGRPVLLQALAEIPLSQQRELVEEGRTVKVIDHTDPSRVEELPLARLPTASVRLVFGDGEIRSPESQRLALRQPRKKKEEPARYSYQPRYDPTSGTVAIGRMSVRLADLLSALASATGPDRPPPSDLPEEYLTCKVRLSREEHKRLQALCRRHELPDWEMIRKALRAFGLI